MNASRDSAEERAGRTVTVAFSRLQDVVYAALGLLPFASAVVLVASVVILRRNDAAP